MGWLSAETGEGGWGYALNTRNEVLSIVLLFQAIVQLE